MKKMKIFFPKKKSAKTKIKNQTQKKMQSLKKIAFSDSNIKHKKKIKHKLFSFGNKKTYTKSTKKTKNNMKLGHSLCY